MIAVTLNDKSFNKQMNNLIAYANGFIDGAVGAKPDLLATIGQRVKESISQYIDSVASANPSLLHHVYEWAQAGSEGARLFDVDYVVSNGGLSINSTFSQSTSIKEGSTTPFYNKAKIMEYGIPVKITPKDGGVLSFDDNGQRVFTRKPIVVTKPGGEAVEGQFENTFDEYFSVYLSQALFSAVGLDYRLSNPIEFKTNMRKGMTGGKAVGVSAGRKWITGGLR